MFRPGVEQLTGCTSLAGTERTRELIDGPCPSVVLNQIAYWSYLDGSWDEAIEVASEGIMDSRDPGGAARCLASLVFALQSAGRGHEVAHHLTALSAATADPAVDADGRWRTAWTLFQSILGTPEAPSVMTQLEAISAELDESICNAELQRMRGRAHLTNAEGPDSIAACIELRESIEMTEAASLRGAWAHTNLAIAAIFG